MRLPLARACLLLGALLAFAGRAGAQQSPVPVLDQRAGTDAELRSALFELISDRPIAAARRLESLRATPAWPSASADPAVDAESRFLLGVAYYRMGMSTRFRALAEPLLATASPRRAALLRAQLALDAYRQGEYARAIEVMPTGTTDPVLRFIAGLAHLQLGDHSSARQAFADVAAGGGAQAQYARYMAAIAMAAADPASTVAAIDSLRLLREGGDELGHAAALAGARLAYALGRHALAAELAGSVSAGSESQPGASLLRAWSLYHQRQLEDAGAAFTEIAERHPATPEAGEARIMAAQTLLEHGRAGAAAVQFTGASDTAAMAVQALGASDTPALAAARGVLSSRTTDMLFVDGRALATVAVPHEVAADVRVLLGDDLQAVGAPLVLITPGTRERWVATVTRTAGTSAAARVLRESASGRVSRDAHAGLSRALREADAERALARYGMREAELRHSLQLAQLDRMEQLVAAEADGLMTIEGRLRLTQDSLVSVLAALGESRDRARRYLRDQIAATRELAAENTAMADSVRQLLGGHMDTVQNELLTIERATTVEFATLASLVSDGLEAAITGHPVFAYHDSVGTRLARSRMLLDDARTQLAAALRIAREELARQRGSEAPALIRARAALDTADRRHRAAEAGLGRLIEMELTGRMQRAISGLQREREVAEYGAASALFFSAVQEDAAAAVGDRSSAIAPAPGGGAP